MGKTPYILQWIEGPVSAQPAGRCEVKNTDATDAELLDAYSRAVTAVVDAVGPAVVSIRVGKPTVYGELLGAGSGVVIAPDGYILTNAHVLQGARHAAVSFTDGTLSDVELIGIDPATDLAVIRASKNRLPYATFAESAHLRTGQLVIAMGNPLGFESSVSTGVVSGTGRNLPAEGGRLIENIIQHTAPLNPGNSGGPLLDSHGHIVGINTAIILQAQGIGFAIPADTAKFVLSHLLRYGRVRRGYLGIVGRDRPLDQDLARALDVENERAVEVVDVDWDGPAGDAGIQTGDLLLALDDRLVGSITDLHRWLAELGPEVSVKLKLLRRERVFTVTVILVEAT